MVNYFDELEMGQHDMHGLCDDKCMDRLDLCQVFTHARYAMIVAHSAVWPCVCLSVRLSQVGVLSKQLDRSSCFLCGSFLQHILHCTRTRTRTRTHTHTHTLRCNEIQVSTEIRILFSGTLC